MDGIHFDRLTRALGHPTARAGRRQILAGMMLAVGQLLWEGGPSTEARPHKRKQRRRRRRQRAANWISSGEPNSTNCEDYMRALKCVWEEGGGGPRWNCPTDIRAGGWRMSVCNGKSGITSLRGADLPSAYFVGADLSGVTFDYANLGARNPGRNRAELRFATLTGASFVHTEMWIADMRQTDLTGISFAGAFLRDVDFGGAANFNPAGAILCDTTMPDGSITACFLPRH